MLKKKTHSQKENANGKGSEYERGREVGGEREM